MRPALSSSPPARAAFSNTAIRGRISSGFMACFLNTGCMVGVAGANSQAPRFLRP